MLSIISLPDKISRSIETILHADEKRLWMQRAERLHNRYLSEHNFSEDFLIDSVDAQSYLALRVPATYAQVYGALTQLKEVMPEWEPQSVLDIGSGPGVGVWAAREVFSGIEKGVCIDKNEYLLSYGKTIAKDAEVKEVLSLLVKDIRYGLGIDSQEKFDIVIISSVLNELPEDKGEQLLRRAMSHNNGILIIIEPGTQKGTEVISHFAKLWSKEIHLIAPYIQSSYVQDERYWIHFSQRFHRPTFQRALRQRMREKDEMASDIEDAKFAYVALGTISSSADIWARCIGPVKIQKGFLEVLVLTKDRVEVVKVMKRHKEQYTYAKNLKWGDTIESREKVVSE